MPKMLFPSEVWISLPFCYSYFFHCCICWHYYMPFCIIFIGNNWCCLCKLSEIQAYWLLMPLSWVKWHRVQLNFLKLKQLLLDSDIQSNPGHTQNDCKSSVRRPVKIKMLKGTKKCDLSENNVDVASDPRLQNCFSNTIHLVTLDIIKSWSVTCASTPKSLQKSEFKVNNDINQNVSYYQGDITKLA